MTDSDLPTSISCSLHAHGLRLTPQRELVLRVLRQAGDHLDAEGIWRRAQQQGARLNLATVYRTLNTLTEIGLVRRSFLDEGQKRAYYEAVLKPEHYHFACLRCGKVLELQSDYILQARKELEHSNGLRIIHTRLKFEGLCPACVNSANAS